MIRLPITALGVMLCAMSAAHPQDLSSDQIRCRLDPACPKPTLRSLPFGQRGVTVNGGAQDPVNSVNFFVTFAYDSAELQTDALISLDALGRALSDKSLAAFDFLIAGHTDVRGSGEYNQRLSEQRARAVADYLVMKFGVDRRRLSIKGFGKEQLYDPTRPEDQVNRRVQVINLTNPGT